ncbi:MAG: hypothetical protein KC592_14505 [Nitrospira sp.]|nr:hypothetical protein [Nitrospira sp.]
MEKIFGIFFKDTDFLHRSLPHGQLSITPRGNFCEKVEGDKVTVDTNYPLNYPLAGIALNFDIKVVSVREATKQ